MTHSSQESKSQTWTLQKAWAICREVRCLGCTLIFHIWMFVSLTYFSVTPCSWGWHWTPGVLPTHLLSTKITSMCLSLCPVYMVMQMKPRDSCVLLKQSINWTLKHCFWQENFELYYIGSTRSASTTETLCPKEKTLKQKTYLELARREFNSWSQPLLHSKS